MATPFDYVLVGLEEGDGGYPNKRFNAKYRCKQCGETWKSKNSSHLKMICKNKDCRNRGVVRAYKFEAVSKLVVYKCEQCSFKIKKTKCPSEVKDVPYCTICQKDMEVYLLKDLWPRKRKFGHFFCDQCHNEWKSGYAWDGVGQKCRLCDIMILPYKLKPLQFNPSSSGKQPHREDLCDMCKQLGRNCKTFNPTNDNVAEMDELPLDEDTQSVITTNSSIFEGGDQADNDGDGDNDSIGGGDRTPINTSDDESDDAPDDKGNALENMFNKLKIAKK